MKKAILSSTLVIFISFATKAHQGSSSSAHQMVVGVATLSAMTLQSVIKANSFQFKLPTSSLHFSEQVNSQRFGRIALSNAKRITLYSEIRDVAGAHRFDLYLADEKIFKLYSQIENTPDPVKKERLQALLKKKEAAYKNLDRLSWGEKEARYKHTFPRTVEVSFDRTPGVTQADLNLKVMKLKNYTTVKSVRILTMFHNARIMSAIKFMRNGTIAVAAISAAGLIAAEEGASARLTAQRNRELARMMEP